MTMILVGEVQMYGQAPQFKSRSVLQAGISQTNPITSQQVSNITFILNGWGLAIRDINLDGWPDLVLGASPVGEVCTIVIVGLGNSPTQTPDYQKRLKSPQSQESSSRIWTAMGSWI